MKTTNHGTNHNGITTKGINTDQAIARRSRAKRPNPVTKEKTNNNTNGNA
ncbi:hypothetical protein LLG39_12390 [bacterium]|nr:hypothetical protein [bacterium]